MKNDFRLDVDRIRAEGISIRIGSPLPYGSVLRLQGHAKISAGLSDLPSLTQYGQVEIVGNNGASSLYISTESLISFPQLFLGFHVSGCPILLGVRKATAGHILILGQTQTGKSTTIASLMFQLSRLGYCTAGVGLKGTDPVVLGGMKIGVDSPTRMDKDGNRHGGPFKFISLTPGEHTHGFNALAQPGFEQPIWMRAGELLLALGMGGGEQDAARRYFTASAQAQLQMLQHWGTSFGQLKEKLDTLKQDRDTRYSTAGLRHEVDQQAAIEQANLPDGHKANVWLGDMMEQRGSIYYSAGSLDAGPVASACAGLFAQAVISVKRKLFPDRNHLLWLFIDEAQLFPLPLLKILIEQAAGSGLRLIVSQHNLSQFGEEWESLSMMQTRLIFGAVPGSATARHLQSLCGTKRDFLFSFNRGNGSSISQTVTQSRGPSGDSASVAEGDTNNKQAGCALTERESDVWGPNETLALNYDREAFVAQVSPGAEFAFFGDKAIFCTRGGSPFSFNEINRVAREVLDDTANKILPGAGKPKLLSAPKLSPELEARRNACLALFETTAAQIREAIH
jgi:hypothetical protein